MPTTEASDEFPVLSEEEWELFEQRVAHFEGALQRGEKPSLAGAASGPDPSGGWLLVELAHADLEFRVAAGEPASAEDYLAAFPESRLGPVLWRVSASWRGAVTTGQPRTAGDRPGGGRDGLMVQEIVTVYLLRIHAITATAPGPASCLS
jgi:hypothetical protein